MTPGANRTREVSLPPAGAAYTAWPAAAQIALGLIVTACVFFLLGRWSNHEPAPILAREPAGAALDVNLATRAELRLLPGLGDALAQRVIDHRQQFGPFRNVDDLRQVPGIGPKTLDRLRPLLFVSTHEGLDFIPPGSKPRAAAASKKVLLLTEPIQVNHADQAELQKLPGIGPKLSQRILDTRAKGSFQSVEDLRRVPGIGPKTLEKLRPHVVID